MNDIQVYSGYGNISNQSQPSWEGNINSVLYIPASELTNNSIVMCAAVGSEELVAISDPANMIVLQPSRLNEIPLMFDTVQ